MKELLSIQDIFIVPFLLIVCYLIATRIKNKHIKEEPYYKYFRIGLFVKIWAGLTFAAVYLFYYGGGDTVYYFHGSQCIVKMAIKDFPTFIKLLLGNHSPEVSSMFDRSTGYPYYFRDPNSFSVCRFNVPIYLISFGSYLGLTIMFNLVHYFFIWNFFHMLSEKYKNNANWMMVAVLFIPSVVFWSSGILKDGWTLTAIYASYYYIHKLITKKGTIGWNLFALLVWLYIAFSIRPYIFYIIIGSGIIWIGLQSMQSIKNHFIRVIAFPIMIITVWLLGVSIIVKTGTYASKRYSSIDNMIETAQIIQYDLTREAYGVNSYNIGSFEPTFTGVMSKFPAAITAGFFRPFIWEFNNFLMLMSGIESIVFMILITFLLVKGRIKGSIRNTFQDPLIISFFVFAVTYAFIVGLTSSNFGALVRYRIPALPLMAIIIAYNFNTLKKQVK